MYISPWLVVIVIIVVFFYLRMRKRNKKNFSPFNLTIIPNWEFLLKDYNLADDKKIEELNKIIYSSEGSYSVLRNGISFTVLQSNEQTDLIYNNTLHTFHSEVDFEEQIREIKLTTPELLLPYSPRFYVKWGIGGYKLGITTPESSKKVIMAGDNNDKVEITTVPYALFNMPKYRLGVLKPEQTEEFVKKNGWRRDESNESLKEDVLFDVPFQLNHKYFTLYYNYI